MKEKLIELGWKCYPCGCPGGGEDCYNKKFNNAVIRLRKRTFRITKAGFIIDSGHAYELENKLKANELV